MMIDFKNKNLILIFILFLIDIKSSVSAPQFDYKSLYMHGQTYENSCIAKQKKLLREQLMENPLPDNEKAWDAIELILCSSNSQINRRKIVSIFDKYVKEKSESPAGKLIFKPVNVNEKFAESIMAVGKAWDANVIVEGNEISLQYFADEACVKSAKLLHRNSGWFIHEIGEACD